ncbi:MAG TPA: RelA/SpoT domain-containing protein, partial [Coleofasciculaceae cyanobacterium]
GDKVRLNEYTDEDVKIIENWRGTHNHILNSWQATLRNRCRGKEVVFAQRLKRRSTIFNKLLRQPGMQLSRMHDIAGCRLIFKDIKELYAYRDSLHAARMEHIRRKTDATPYPYDYIQTPASSGYRGIHDVYEYKARAGRATDWNGLLVEIQYRTIFQHAWATAVEVAGSLTGNHSKFNQGSDSQKEFFRLSSEIIARAFEQSKSCRPELSDSQLIVEFNKLENKIKLLRDLETLRVLKGDFPIPSAKNFILQFLKKPEPTYICKIYSFETLPLATSKYFELEKSDPEDDIVLVRAESLESIKNAFRNYFSDVEDFVHIIKEGKKKLAD